LQLKKEFLSFSFYILCNGFEIKKARCKQRAFHYMIISMPGGLQMDFSVAPPPLNICFVHFHYEVNVVFTFEL
jgi:hypothetical protein